jgi:methylmalonyl-CoA mutase N-terminal domain/subunit
VLIIILAGEEEDVSDTAKRTILFRKEVIKKIKLCERRWEEEYLRPEGKESEEPYLTSSGIPIKPLYSPADIEEFDYRRDLGFPGTEPFTRGIYPTMYRGRPSGFGGPEDCNNRLKFLLKQGASGINIVFDLPTIRGYDSEDPEAEGNVGQCGVTIDSIEDMHTLFAGIPIDTISVSLVTHLPSVTTILLAMYLVMAEERGIRWEKLAGTSQNDFLMETTIGSAPEIMPPQDSFRLQCDVIEFVTGRLPRWNPISYNGYNLREAGTNAVQEVAVAISNAIHTIEELRKRGLDVDAFAPRLSFFWDLCNDFFEEIAKCRASRRVWYKIMKEHFGAKNQRSMWMRFHVQTSGVSLTAIEPLNNIARSTIQGLAGVLGGAQSLHIDSYDEAYSVPTEMAALVSLRTQQIIQAETNVTNVVDPLGGSYYMENLTDQMEQRIYEYMEKIKSSGGLIKAVDTGWLHREIADQAYEYQKATEDATSKIVGVNYYPSDEVQRPIEVFKYPNTEEKQRAKLKELLGGITGEMHQWRERNAFCYGKCQSKSYNWRDSRYL